ncbi:hypothetical protein AMS68_006757 [Peltaster fructicola]|uniref:Vacuolar calcium ion transporter n=1 Tax=Peltaster fructicola TaxID=286661 RepID=A0A6H0Y3N2_9PEZI|nr:hypothetical protein AMS68_006757 [Peltaster fructicola]
MNRSATSTTLSSRRRRPVAKVFKRRQSPQIGSSDFPAPAAHAQPQQEQKVATDKEGQALEEGTLPRHESEKSAGRRASVYNHNGHKVTRGIQPEGESGRRGFHPWKFVKLCCKSSCTASMLTNFLWPFVIAAMVLHFNYKDHQLWIFVTAYLGMLPAANLIGFAGQELARKLPTVLGVILETTFGSIVEIVVFMVLIKSPGEDNFTVIRAAILGSILANLLLCLGLCFFVGGIFHPQQSFDEAISEVGGNLMFVASCALVIPTIYYNSLSGNHDATVLEDRSLQISRATAIVLLMAFSVYMFFQVRSHHGIYEDILHGDEQQDYDRDFDLKKEKLTFTESVVGVALGITFVTFMAIFLVQQIEYIKDRGLSDSFIGLILIPVVEKAAEHLTAMDEAYDNQMNFALAHVLGASIQTALLNTPLVVLVAWGLGKPLSLNFELFDAVLLILAVVVIGNFLRDGNSDYLEGSLSVFVYILIAVSAWYYPNPTSSTEPSSGNTVAENAARWLVGG